MKLLYKLRSALPWRVNCWFCNNNFWIKYPDRNSWTCRICEQYNGFTKDGDYNKPIPAFTEKTNQTPKVFQSSPPKNGLCRMCNVNQQLKVTQLANFVPMNEKNYDEEIESYRLQLEKAYKLCSPCKKVLQVKLYKEKETLLGSKLLATRTPEKKNQKHEKQNRMLKMFINSTSLLIALILFILVSFELYTNLTLRYQNLLSTITNIKEIALGLLETKALGAFVCFLQTIGLIWNVNNLKNTIIIDLLWLVFAAATLDLALEPIYLSLIKVICTLVVIIVYKSIKAESKMHVPSSPKRMKNLIKGSVNTLIDEYDDHVTLDTDDDVSLSKFGLHNFSESSNDTFSPLNASFMNGRTFTPRSDSLWTKPKLNSTFCVNSVTCKSPSSVSDNIFVKPSFNKYQKLAKDDSDSELDESISSLCIGSPKKSKNKTNSIFSLRKFSATPSFVAPTPMTRSRPLISPSKLGHSTSWVAGGYWGSESERQLFSIDGSRSSSQSSGFESQTSSMNQRNVFSQPPSREDSVCGEPMVMDRYPAVSNCMLQTPQNYRRVSSPVYPQMQFNNHVQIPQPKFAQQYPVPRVPGCPTAFTPQQSYVESSMFKTPSESGLINLQQVNSLPSR
ncbi:unnamed protein product [Arctia plantaginis]|uniref:Ima1 N-terminal domain-containing protein n=1 Tax=Arctia plantaginis TaxID=874455 RepID=A0A8S0YPW6_ARCPL|nr:unnamed protein product [Arctia plantaginis]